MKQSDRFKRLFYKELGKLYNADGQLIGALLHIRDQTSNRRLHKLFLDDQKKKKDQIKRLKAIGKNLNTRLVDASCKPMRILIEKTLTIIDKKTPAEQDRELIANVRKIQEYEIAAYKSALEFAKALHLDKIIAPLKLSLSEEMAANRSLRNLAETY